MQSECSKYMNQHSMWEWTLWVECTN